MPKNSVTINVRETYNIKIFSDNQICSVCTILANDLNQFPRFHQQLMYDPLFILSISKHVSSKNQLRFLFE